MILPTRDYFRKPIAGERCNLIIKVFLTELQVFRREHPWQDSRAYEFHGWDATVSILFESAQPQSLRVLFVRRRLIQCLLTLGIERN